MPPLMMTNVIPIAAMETIVACSRMSWASLTVSAACGGDDEEHDHDDDEADQRGQGRDRLPGRRHGRGNPTVSD
jgi:hypothetical protein